MIPTFTEVLNVSISASWLVLAVAALRFLLKKAPKWMVCALWALVAVRLLCPVSIVSDFSLVPSTQTVPEEYLYMEGTLRQEPATLEIVENPALGENVQLELDTTVDRIQTWDMNGTLVWLCGMGIMLIYSVYSYLSLRLRVRFAAPAGQGVWECDEISSPFILGLLQPRIYLPSTLDEGTAAHVLAHERSHLKRLDHVWKPLGFALLTVHWFNPVMWLAYILLCRDIELACDERVIRDMEKGEVRAYSEALISCSVSPRMIAACPLAFGEVGVTGRIKAMLHYKKPGFWMMVLTIAAAALAAVSFLTDPPTREADLEHICVEEGYIITDQQEWTVNVMLYKHWLPENVLNGAEHTFEPDEIVVAELETTTLYLKSARLFGNELLLSFNCSYELPESGTVWVPYRLEEDGIARSTDEMIEDGSVMDSVTEHPDAVRIHGSGPDSEFGICIKADVWNSAEDFVSFLVDGLYGITYVSEDADITPLIGTNLSAAQTLYSRPDYSYPPEELAAYYVRSDLTLLMRQQSEIGDISHYMGELQPMELDAAWFDGLFQDEYWLTKDETALSLRRMNQSVWRCDTDTTIPEVTHVLLHQKNGDVYMMILADGGQTLTQLFRLEAVPDVYDPELVSFRTYEYRPESGSGSTQFRLYSDGTFTLSEALYLSYLPYGRYTLSGGVLTLRTEDGRYIWHFIADGENFRFDGAGSSVLHTWPGGRNGLVELTDGAVFELTGALEVGEAPTASIDLPELIDLDQTIVCFYAPEGIEGIPLESYLKP